MARNLLTVAIFVGGVVVVGDDALKGRFVASLAFLVLNCLGQVDENFLLLGLKSALLLCPDRPWPLISFSCGQVGNLFLQVCNKETNGDSSNIVLVNRSDEMCSKLLVVVEHDCKLPVVESSLLVGVIVLEKHAWARHSVLQNRLVDVGLHAVHKITDICICQGSFVSEVLLAV